MTAYLIFVGIVMLLLLADWLQKREGYGGFAIAALLVAIAFGALRYNTGYDYRTYSSFYLHPDEMRNTELGFKVVVVLLRSIGLGSWWMFAAFAIAVPLFMWRGVKLQTPNVRLAMLIYLLIPGMYLNSFSILRQALAIVLVFNAFHYYMEGQKGRFWGWYLCGVLFHYSALMVLPFFLLSPRISRYARELVLIGIPISLVLSQIDLLGPITTVLLSGTKYSDYGEFTDGGTKMIKLLVLDSTLVFYMCFFKHMDARQRTMLVLITLGMMLVNTFSSVGAITRIAFYFRIFEIVLMASMVPFFKRSSRPIFCVLVVSYFFAMFYGSLSNDYYNVEEQPKLTPYQTIFSK